MEKEKKAISIYADIIDLPHHVSQKHEQMAISDRAAQFSPFSALAGYEDAVAETGRYTEERVSLSDDEVEKLNRQVDWLQRHIAERPKVKITFFLPDCQKSGGVYRTAIMTVKKVDISKKSLVGEDGRAISFADISEITEIG